jgi:hypothetical protein
LDIQQIVSELKDERDRIGKAISALLEGVGISSTNGSRRRGQPPGRAKGMSPADRKRLSQAMKARWAARRTKSPSTAKPAVTAGRKHRTISAAARTQIARR